ncbi:INO80 complex subunit 4 [Colletotrichum tanaceti]|uniref:INO80 complex subunit 4 n=1 Tax=Colletotrichum tanaceti TaxID=1306861 RepID=A0A4U6XBG7_9PEZI|nr:INO80 complex subunit 4 [Colletotrichum tanaceti]TKW52714.1 INO80 complex subunit 4 [Colletotrichum tanaceti]
MSPTPSVSRRKSNGGKGGLVVTLAVSADRLKQILDPEEDSPVKMDVEETNGTKETQESQDSPATSTTLPAPVATNGETASDSNPGTPAGDGTPAPTSMGPPTEGIKKKGTKRSAAAVNGLGPDGQPKIRGKPGPKKKARLYVHPFGDFATSVHANGYPYSEDGTIDPNARAGAAGHKLGPKANQGAINAGLRALDRSGKPCRKWAKGGFTLKSFTGIIWEVPRWVAPPKTVPESNTEDSAAASIDSSSKENKENDQVKSDANSAANSGADIEMRSAPGSVPASSPAPMAITAAS